MFLIAVNLLALAAGKLPLLLANFQLQVRGLLPAKSESHGSDTTLRPPAQSDEDFYF